MRRALALLILAVPVPVAAQAPDPYRATLQMQQMELQSQQDMARLHGIQQQNDLNALDAQLRTDRALAEAPALHVSPPRVVVPRKPLAKLPAPYPSMPDDFLAQSRARVEAASRNRR